MASVTLKDVRKVYENGFEAVKQASFEIEDGEFIVLVGPSGCGKSTTLRMIAGLESVTSGEIEIGDRVVNDVPPKDRDIAMVFQNYALYPHMTVFDNMAFGLKLRKYDKSEIKSRVESAAATLGITEILDRKPKQLSGGQRQRVAVGRAIVRKPSVFLFDEPLSNLDAKLRVQMRTEISKLHASLAATMIYVTHDQVEAMTMGDRIVVLNDGVIQQIDPPLRLYNEPVNAFVAGFIGSPSMNFLPGRLSQDGSQPVFISEECGVRLGLSDQGGTAGAKVTLGIRPENLTIHPNPAVTLGEAIVEVVEPMGNEIVVYLKMGPEQVVARIQPQSVPGVGETLTVGIDPQAIHLFDGESGNRISARANREGAAA